MYKDNKIWNNKAEKDFFLLKIEKKVTVLAKFEPSRLTKQTKTTL